MSVCVSWTGIISISIRASDIHGKGLFAQKDLPAGEIIYESNRYIVSTQPVYGSIQRSIHEHLLEDLLRWENHSCKPNSKLIFTDSVIQLKTQKTILNGTEIVCNYRETEDRIPLPFRCNCGYCAGIMIT